MTRRAIHASFIHPAAVRLLVITNRLPPSNIPLHSTGIFPNPTYDRLLLNLLPITPYQIPQRRAISSSRGGGGFNTVEASSTSSLLPYRLRVQRRFRLIVPWHPSQKKNKMLYPVMRLHPRRTHLFLFLEMQSESVRAAVTMRLSVCITAPGPAVQKATVPLIISMPILPCSATEVNELHSGWKQDARVENVEAERSQDKVQLHTQEGEEYTPDLGHYRALLSTYCTESFVTALPVVGLS
jgi:hypothetical protein